MVSALLAGALGVLARALRRAARCAAARAEEPPEGNGRRGRPLPGVDGLAVATGVWICALAAVTWAMNPYAAGVLVLATHLWLFAAGGWRGWPALVAPCWPASCRSCSSPSTTASRSTSARSGWPGARRWPPAGLRPVVDAAARRACWPRSRASIRVLLARRRIARDDGAGGGGRSRPAARSATPGPGSLGGTESALRR